MIKKTSQVKKPATKKVAVKAKQTAAKPNKLSPKKTAPKKADAVKKTKTVINKPKLPRTMSSAKKYKMVETAAYYIAEKDGFSGDPHKYWLMAEKKILRMLSKK